RLHRVLRAARVEAAVLPQQRADETLVAAQQREGRRLHRRTPRRNGLQWADKLAALMRLRYNTRPLRLKESQGPHRGSQTETLEEARRQGGEEAREAGGESQQARGESQ